MDDAPREYENANMPRHEGDQYDAEILEHLRAVMLSPSGSYLVMALDGKMDAVCVVTGVNALARLENLSIMRNALLMRCDRSAEMIVTSAMARLREDRDGGDDDDS